MRKDSRGFTFAELMVVVTIIMLLCSISLPNYWHAKELASFTACVQNRRVLEKAESHYYLDHGKHSVGPPPVLEKEGYANPSTICPAGGKYYWVWYPTDDPRYHSEIGCSIHGPDKDHNSNLDTPEQPKPKPKPKPEPKPEPKPVPAQRRMVPVQPYE